MGPKGSVATPAGGTSKPTMEPIRRSTRNKGASTEKKKQQEEERAKASAGKAKPKSAAGKSATGIQGTHSRSTGRGRGAKKIALEEELADVPAKKNPAAARKPAPKKGTVPANKPNTKKPRMSKKQILFEQEGEDGEESAGESTDGEEVAPAPVKKKKKVERLKSAPAQQGRKRKSGAAAASQPDVKRRKIAVPKSGKGKGNQVSDSSPELDEEEESEKEPEESDEEREEGEVEEEEQVQEQPAKRPKNKGKIAHTGRKNPRVTRPKDEEDEEDIHYLPDFKTADDFDKTSPGITYNSSPSEEVPNVTIPIGFKIKVTAFEITRVESKTESSLFECNCKQYKGCTFLKTCKHLLLINGPRFERKRLNEIKAKLDGKNSSDVTQEGLEVLEVAPAKSTEAIEGPAAAGGQPPSESPPAVVDEESTQMDVDGEEDGISGQ
ncbi:hypothetical protein EYR41_007012 [Orbilia oligospora]|uniref:Uncharacterized protein n=1 Tax=Orbilia oligospora TaxID=2813651 RepID=A0A7C8KJE3_ORBOL|nr:hypothetical protein TWF751_010358 [Orbilia oligospora]KAF3293916.1 hypothetical protein TWF132_003808 [Orbilia oligospora]TGJ67918.1 hypothetical protein EYR41_007012 [Orbilia oligospora]